MITIRQLAGLLGLPRLSPARLALAFGLLIVAVGVTTAGLVSLVGALRLVLMQWVSPASASVLVGLVLLLLAGVLLLIARRLTRPLPAPKQATSADAATVEAVAWIQQHPGQSAVLAAIVGFCMGASPETRKAVIDLAKPKR